MALQHPSEEQGLDGKRLQLALGLLGTPDSTHGDSGAQAEVQALAEMVKRIAFFRVQR